MSQNGKRLLIVGDSPAVLQAACAQLAESGYTIDQVSRGSEARSHVERHGLPHLAVIVLPLPDGDGLPLCQELSERARLPLIALAGPGSAEEAAQALPVVDASRSRPASSSPASGASWAAWPTSATPPGQRFSSARG